MRPWDVHSTSELVGFPYHDTRIWDRKEGLWLRLLCFKMAADREARGAWKGPKGCPSHVWFSPCHILGCSGTGTQQPLIVWMFSLSAKLTKQLGLCLYATAELQPCFILLGATVRCTSILSFLAVARCHPIEEFSTYFIGFLRASGSMILQAPLTALSDTSTFFRSLLEATHPPKPARAPQV